MLQFSFYNLIEKSLENCGKFKSILPVKRHNSDVFLDVFVCDGKCFRQAIIGNARDGNRVFSVSGSGFFLLVRNQAGKSFVARK